MVNERYKRVFTLTNYLYHEGSPVVLTAGALLKDTRTGGVLAQLKFKSVDERSIKALRLTLQPYDVTGAALGEPVPGQYLDLNVGRDEEFGQRVPIALTDASTRSLSLTSLEVVFADNDIWKDDGRVWEPLPEQRTLSKWLGNDEHVRQFCIEYGEQCEYEPVASLDLWGCTCGALNRSGEDACHVCGLERESIFSVDFDVLDVATRKRLACELAEQEAAKRERDAREQERQAARKRRGKIAAIVTGAVVVAFVGFFVVTRVIIPQRELADAYASAMALLDDGSYVDAARAFEGLGDYSDASEMVERSRALGYESAVDAFESGSFEEAKSLFVALGKYGDAREQAVECDKAIAYEHGLSLLEAGADAKAYAQFKKAADFKDATDYLRRFVLVPEKIRMNSLTYTFIYDDHGRMSGASFQNSVTVNSVEHNYITNYIFTDGMLIRRESSSDGSTYDYSSPDYIIMQHSSGGRNLFDKYGNYLTFGMADKDGWEDQHRPYDELDEHYNPKRLSLNYDEDGNPLIDEMGCTVTYQAIYLPDEAIDRDVVWRNIKLVTILFKR